MTKPRVIIRSCPEYDVEKIREIVRQSLDELGGGFNFAGKVFIKPNVVSANKGYIHDSYTNPKVVEAVAGLVNESKPQRLTIGESGGYGIPSRLFLKEAGYFDLGKKVGAEVIDLNEHELIKVKLERATCHKEALLSRRMVEADVKIWLPKLKFHIFASITCSLKLNIGILSHKERMLYHDWRIHEKIVDLLEPGYPDLIVADAIDITYGFESAPYPVRLGALLVSRDPLALDAVAAHIMGYDPKDVKHLKIAADRGFGTIDLSEIEITGDADIEELRAKPKGKPRLFQVLNELETPIRFFAGFAKESDIICDGGCEGALKGCLGTIEKRRPGSLVKAKKGAIVTGVFRGDVICPDGPVLLIGDCTKVTGKLEAKSIHRVKGCPVGARDLFVKVPRLFDLPSPMLDFRDASLFLAQNVVKGSAILKNKLAGD